MKKRFFGRRALRMDDGEFALVGCGLSHREAAQYRESRSKATPRAIFIRELFDRHLNDELPWRGAGDYERRWLVFLRVVRELAAAVPAEERRG